MKTTKKNAKTILKPQKILKKNSLENNIYQFLAMKNHKIAQQLARPQLKNYKVVCSWQDPCSKITKSLWLARQRKTKTDSSVSFWATKVDIPDKNFGWRQGRMRGKWEYLLPVFVLCVAANGFEHLFCFSSPDMVKYL